MITLETMEIAPLAGLAVAAGAGVTAVVALARVVALQKRVVRLEKRLRDAVSQFQGLTAGSVGQGQHIGRLESELARLRDRLDRVASQETGDAAFGQAIRMARHGTDAEEIMTVCGLSRMEADLVIRLHREGRAAE